MAKKKSKSENVKPKIIHPWRICPVGEYWVRSHPLHIPSSKKNPAGSITVRQGHCARNPTGKDQLYPDEIQEIARRNFADVKEIPCSLDLGFKGIGSKYDVLIAGWTKYWNEVLQPKTPLNPNFVKALIASESGFASDRLANSENSNSARGLMQILNSARKTLGDEKGELQNHFLTVTKSELNEPGINICAGIRWLFQKQKLASSYLERDATWEEAIMNYKGKLRSKVGNPEAEKQKKIFNGYLDRLEKCGK